jgi:hypothetical protein
VFFITCCAKDRHLKPFASPETALGLQQSGGGVRKGRGQELILDFGLKRSGGRREIEVHIWHMI